MASEKSSTAVIRGPRSPPPYTLVTARASSSTDISHPGCGFQRPLRRARLMEMAGHQMVRANLAKRRRVDLATVHRMRTARAERTALRPIEQRRRQTWYALKGALAVERRQARDQQLAVRV